MKKTTYHLFLLFCLLNTYLSHSQQKAVNIGDELPAQAWKQLAPVLAKAYGRQTKNPVILIEFWSSHCSGCISSMQKLYTLKKKFNGKLQVVLLTYESLQKAQMFFNKRPDLASLNLPYLPQTPSWKKWFPYNAFPHIIWIGPDKKVKAITGSSYVTEDNISQLLQNNSINLPVKKDIEGFNSQSSIMHPAWEQPAICYSALTGPISGTSSSGGAVNTWQRDYKRLYSNNASIFSLYATAYRPHLFLDVLDYESRFVLQVRDSTLFKKNEYGHYQTFSYELVMHQSRYKDNHTMHTFMQQDLDRFFGFQSKVVNMPVTAWVISPLDSTSKKTEGKESVHSTLNEVVITNFRAANLLLAIKQSFRPDKPVVYNGPANYKVSGSLKTHYIELQELKQDLNKLGLCINLQQIELQQLVITED